MAISGTSITMSVLATVAKALALPGSGASSSLVYSKQISYDDGTGDGQCNVVYAEERTLGNGATDSLDLSGVMLQTPLGTDLALTKVKAIAVYADPGNTDTIVIGGAGATAFMGPFGANTDTIALGPGGMVLLSDPLGGWDVTATTADILKIVNSAAGAQAIYDIMIFGVGTPD